MPDTPPGLADTAPPFYPSNAPVGCAGSVVGGLSFIPLIGVPFGVVAIIWGLARQAWGLVILGCGGILLSVILCCSFYYFGFEQHSGVYDKLREQLTVSMLNDAVKDIEFYKIQHGRYPAQLSELDTKNINKPVFLVDPTAIQRGQTKDAYFYYELARDGKSYLLRSVGADGIPFTGDDLLPPLSEEERKNTGLKLER